jgi:hypothetical protein
MTKVVAGPTTDHTWAFRAVMAQVLATRATRPRSIRFEIRKLASRDFAVEMEGTVCGENFSFLLHVTPLRI